MKRFSTSLCFEVSFVHNSSWTHRHFHRKRNFRCTILAPDNCKEPQVTVSDFDHTKPSFFFPNNMVYKYFPKNKAILALQRKYAPYFGFLDLNGWMDVNHQLLLSFTCDRWRCRLGKVSTQGRARLSGSWHGTNPSTKPTICKTYMTSE